MPVMFFEKKFAFLCIFSSTFTTHILLCNSQPVSAFAAVFDQFQDDSPEKNLTQNLIIQTNEMLNFLNNGPLPTNVRPEHLPEISALLTRIKFARQKLLDLLPHNKDLQKAEQEDTLKLRTLTFQYFEELDKKFSRTENIER